MKPPEVVWPVDPTSGVSSWDPVLWSMVHWHYYAETSGNEGCPWLTLVNRPEFEEGQRARSGGCWAALRWMAQTVAFVRHPADGQWRPASSRLLQWFQPVRRAGDHVSRHYGKSGPGMKGTP